MNIRIPISAIPAALWILGWASLLNGIASEMILTVLPLFMVSTIGASMATIGLMEGTAQLCGLILKIFSGFTSDALGNHKTMIILGYIFSSTSKLIFPTATSSGAISAARCINLIGKDIREAPREALLSSVAPKDLRNSYFGTQELFDTAGIIIGPILAMLCMLWITNMRIVLWIAALFSLTALALLIIGLPRLQTPASTLNKQPSMTTYKELSARYWLFLLPITLLYGAHCSQAFIIVQAYDVGIPIGYISGLIILSNIFYVLAVYYTSTLPATVNKKNIISIGMLLLIGAYTCIAYAQHWLIMIGGIILRGLYYGLTRSVLATIIAESTPMHLQGTAYSIFHTVTSCATLCTNIAIGLAWNRYSSTITFIAIAVVTATALCTWIIIEPPARQAPL